MSALALRASLETQLKQVDAQAAVARSEAASASPTLALQQHMLTYQREADEAASKQLQAEVARLRESEGARIRTEERAAARAELDRVLQEQQTWHAKQVAAMRRQEIEAREALRKREADFEAKAYEQRQRLLSEAERLRAREALLAMETEARANELKAQAEMLTTQKAVLERDMTSVRRAREVELQAAQAELAAAGRELRITHQQRLLEELMERCFRRLRRGVWRHSNLFLLIDANAMQDFRRAQLVGACWRGHRRVRRCAAGHRRISGQSVKTLDRP
jgi:hypothetical protein